MVQNWTPRPGRAPAPADARPPATGSRATRVAIGVISLLGVGTIALSIAALVVSQARKNRPVFLESGTPAEKQAELRAAFNAPDAGIDPATLAEIERLFDQVVAATGESDEAGFQALIDRDRLFEAIKSSGLLPRGAGRSAAVREYLLRDLWIPWNATRYHIAHVTLEGDGAEAVVYGYFWTAASEAAEMRWWIVRRDGAWKPYDWELLQTGGRCSRKQALYQRLDTTSYSQVINDLHAAQDAFSSGDVETALQRMRRAERGLPSVPEPLRNEATLWTAYYWYFGDRHEEARRVAGQIAANGRQPGVYFLQMQRAAHRREHDQLLAAASEYEAALGRNPNSAQLRATALFELDRRDEAANACRDYLHCDPGHVDMLRQLALACRGDVPRELTECVAASRDPVQTAMDLSEVLARYGDTASVKVLSDLVIQRVPDTSQAAAVLAVAAEAELDDEAATSRILQALQQEPDDARQAEWLWKYLAIMTRLERVVEAFRSAPDPGPAFASLANSEDEPVSSLESQVLRELLDAYEPRGGVDDPFWWLHKGNRAADDGDDEQAVECYERGLGLVKGDDDESGAAWMLESQFTDILLRTGRWRDAWSRAGDDDSERESIADQLLWAERFRDLAELASAWREADPKQPLVDYYAAAAAVERGDLDEAERRLDDGESLLGEEAEDHRRSAFRALRARVWVKRDDPLAHYDAVAAQPDLANQLVWRLMGEERREPVAGLADRLREDHPESATGWFWAIRLRWDDQDYDGVRQLMDETPRSVWDTMDANERRACEEFLFRSRLRLQQTEEALRQAESADQGEANPLWQLIANAVAGRPEPVGELIARLPDYRFRSVYADEDAGPVLLGPDFRSLREQFPPWLPYARDNGWLALLRDPRQLTVEELKRAVADAWGAELQVEELLHPAPGQSPTFVIVRGETRFVVTCGTGPYQKTETIDLADVRDQGAADALRQHAGWVAVSPVAQPGIPPGRQQQPTEVSDLLRQLAGDGLLGAYNTEQRRLVLAGASLDQIMSGHSSPQSWTDAGESVWLWRGNAGDEVAAAVPDRVRRRLIRAGLALWRTNDGSFEALLGAGSGEAREQLAVRVERVKPSGYTGFQYDGRLLYDSQLFPWLRAGELVRFWEYDVVDWTDGSGVSARAEAAEWWRQLQERSAAADSTTESTDADHPGN
jgi:predicted Zn-dependent protease